MSTTRNDWAHIWLRIREWAFVWRQWRTMVSSTGGGTLDCYGVTEPLVINDGFVGDPDVDQGEKIGVLSQRSLFAGLFSSPRAFLDPLLLQLSRAMGYPQTDPLAVIPILFLYMSNNQGSLRSAPKLSQRGFTRNAWTAAGSNKGNGDVLRLTVDRFGNPIESDQADVLNFICKFDRNSGTNPGAESFQVSGLPFKDILALYTAGYSIGVGNQIPVNNLVGVDGIQTQNFIQNPSFASVSGTNATATFALTGWTINTPANVSGTTTAADLYRASSVETTPGALLITGTTVFTTTIPVGKLKRGAAYMAQLAANFSLHGGTGSVKLEIGDTSTPGLSITVASGVSGWNQVRFALDKKLYYDNWATGGDVTVRITVTVTAGTITIDDLCFAQFQSIAGKLLWAIGGTANWLVNDTATLTDTVPTTTGVPTTGYVQTLFSEAYGVCLPAYAASTKPTNPTAAGTGGGTGASGLYSVVVTFYNATTGLESAPSAEQYVQLDGTNTDRIALTSIQTGPAGTTDRFIHITQKNDANSNGFRESNGPVSAHYYITNLGDNAATSKTFDPTSPDLTKPLAPLVDI